MAPSTPIVSRARWLKGPKARPGGQTARGVGGATNAPARSNDHRKLDGREAGLGLVAMKDALEDPARLLFDI